MGLFFSLGILPHFFVRELKFGGYYQMLPLRSYTTDLLCRLDKSYLTAWFADLSSHPVASVICNHRLKETCGISSVIGARRLSPNRVSLR